MYELKWSAKSNLENLIVDIVLGIGIINTHFRKYQRSVLQHASSEMSHQSSPKLADFSEAMLLYIYLKARRHVQKKVFYQSRDRTEEILLSDMIFHMENSLLESELH